MFSADNDKTKKSKEGKAASSKELQKRNAATIQESSKMIAVRLSIRWIPWQQDTDIGTVLSNNKIFQFQIFDFRVMANII